MAPDAKSKLRLVFTTKSLGAIRAPYHNTVWHNHFTPSHVIPVSCPRIAHRILFSFALHFLFVRRDTDLHSWIYFRNHSGVCEHLPQIAQIVSRLPLRRHYATLILSFFFALIKTYCRRRIRISLSLFYYVHFKLSELELILIISFYFCFTNLSPFASFFSSSSSFFTSRVVLLGLIYTFL